MVEFNVSDRVIILVFTLSTFSILSLSFLMHGAKIGCSSLPVTSLVVRRRNYPTQLTQCCSVGVAQRRFPFVASHPISSVIQILFCQVTSPPISGVYKESVSPVAMGTLDFL